MIKSRLAGVRAQAAADPDTSAADLTVLAADPSRTVRLAVAARTDAPAPALLALAADPAWQVREAISQNAGVVPEILIALITDSHWQVRWSIPDNPAADVTVQYAICDSPEVDLRRMLASLSRRPTEITARLAADESGEVRAALAENTTDLAALAGLLTDDDPRVRMGALSNRHVTAAQRRALVHDPIADVRGTAALNQSGFTPGVPAEDLILLARDRAVSIRMMLANLPGVPRAVLDILAEDPDRDVATTARLRLP